MSVPEDMPLQDVSVIDALGADLRAAGYGIDAVFALLGEPVAAALRRGLRWPALRATVPSASSRWKLSRRALSSSSSGRPRRRPTDIGRADHEAAPTHRRRTRGKRR